MTNEISINWDKNQSTENPIFEMFDDSEFESIQQETMALYGEACYIQEQYEEYILESNDSGIGTNVLRLIGNLIGRFIRAITRFMKNKTCQKAIEYIGSYKMTKVSIRDYIKDNWPLKKGDPGYTLLTAALRMKFLLKHVDLYEDVMKSKDKDVLLVDTGKFTVTDVDISGALRVLDKMFSKEGGLDGSNKTLKDVIKVLEKFNTYWTPFDDEGKNSVVVEMITTDIKAFAQFQKELLEAYKFFSSKEFQAKNMEKVSKDLEESVKRGEDTKKEMEKLKKENNEKQKKINERIRNLLNAHGEDISIEYK